jgi:hypothetical protein
MTFPLIDIEQHLDERWVLQGEQLLDRNAVSQLKELEKHLWVASVDQFEIELQITPSKVKAVTCECDHFSSYKSCEHIAAGLMVLRNQIQAKKAKAAAPKETKKVKSNQKLTVHNILEAVPQEDLLDFVKYYARNNNNFAIALKARFASQVPTQDKEKKFRQLIESTINAARNKSDKFTYRGTQKVQKVVKELLAQVDNTIRHHNLPDAALILQILLSRLGPVYRKAEGNPDGILDTLRTVFRRLNTVLDHQPAPSLKNEIWENMLKEAQKSSFKEFQLATPLYELLLRLADDQEKTSLLLEQFQQRIGQLSIGNPERSFLLIKIFQVLEKEGRKPEIQQHLVNYIEEPSFLLFVLQHAFDQEQYQRAKFLAEKGLPLINDKEVSEKIDEILLQTALIEQDQEAIFLYARRRFIQTQDIRYVAHMKDYSQQSWPEVANDLLESLKPRPFTIKKRDAMAHLFLEKGKLEELRDYIERIQSLDLLQQYDRFLLDLGRESLTELYEKLLIQYLNNHLGRKPSQRIRIALGHLHASGFSDLAEELIGKVRAAFPERHSLIEELEIFSP